MSVMSKRILVSLPAEIYQDLKRTAKAEYKSVSGIIRESIVNRLSTGVSDKEMALIAKGQAEYRQGKGKDWREIRRGDVYKRLGSR